MGKIVHQLSVAGIQTHDLLNISLLPQPLDHDFPLPTNIVFITFYETCGQSYKASTLVNYDSRVVSNVLVITSLES